jgi:DNA-nicking Smr family endonuclease
VKIDLHGVKHEDVKRKLDVFFWESIQKNMVQVEVVTGHSIKMKEIVYEVCQEYGFSIKEGVINKGYLIVDI